MPAVFSTKKASSHLPPNFSAHDRARKYPDSTFHMDDGLMFCSAVTLSSIIFESPWWTSTLSQHDTKNPIKTSLKLLRKKKNCTIYIIFHMIDLSNRIICPENFA